MGIQIAASSLYIQPSMNDRPLVGDQTIHRSVFNHSNEVLDNPGIVIQYPEISTVKWADKAEYLRRLDVIESPSQRVLTLIKSVFIPWEEPTYEALMIRTSAFGGGCIGFLHGAIMRSQDLHAKYAREHNASVFEHKVLAHRHHFDYLVKNVSIRAWPYAFKSALLCGAASSIAFGTIVYRSDVHYSDWLVGFTTLGALSRSWLGLRGMIGGGMFGVAASVLGYGVAKGYELFTGQTIPQMRYNEHKNWLERREKLRARAMRVSEDAFREINAKLD